jgi:hypothetical protein
VHGLNPQHFSGMHDGSLKEGRKEDYITPAA